MDASMDSKMTINEIAEAIGITRSTAYRWARSGKNLSWSVSSNGRPYATRDDVRRFLEGYLGRRCTQ